MHDDGSRGPTGPLGTGSRPRHRVFSDLRRRGVPDRYCESLAERLSELSHQLTTSEYHAALLATATAVEAIEPEGAIGPCAEDQRRDVREIQHLMQGFAAELRKVEEGLGVLSAYLIRLRATAEGDPGAAVQ